MTLERIEFKNKDKLFIFDFYAKRFLWTMIRKIVTVLRMVSQNRMSLEELEFLLKGEGTKKPELAEPYGLILMDTYYDNVHFKYDKEAIDFFKDNIEKKISIYLSRYHTYEVMSEAFGGLR